jgi:pilin isopeptide linkage protein
MKKTTKKITAIMAALLATATIGASAAMPVFALDSSVAASILDGDGVQAGTNGILTFTKCVTTPDDGGVVPTETYNFKLVPYTGTIAEGTTSNGLKVYTGILTNGAGNSTTERTASISYDTDVDTTPTSTVANLNVNLFTKTTSFDLSDVKFEKEGIYRYEVTETAGANTAYTTYDTTKYIVDVAVTWNETDEKYEISYFKSVSTEDLNSKVPIVFTNELSEGRLVIYKQVTGNAGSKTEDFAFTLNIAASTGLPTGTKLTAKRYDAKGNQVGNDIELVVGSDSTFELSHGQTLEIDGLPVTTVYTVTETDYSNDGYTTKIKTLENKAQVGDEAETNTVTNAIVAGGNREQYVNNKSVETDTGIALTITPIAIAGGLAAAGAVTYIIKRKISK